LNQPPKTATATVLLAFLQPSLHALYALDRKQTIKILNYINEFIIPPLENDKNLTNARRAALTRLKLFLENNIRNIKSNRNLELPEGYSLPETQESDTSQQIVTHADYDASA
jgi:hypothetical protein